MPKEFEQKKESNTAHIIKNIVIGVVTSVVAALIIYFIQNPNRADFAKKKKATLSAWNSYLKNNETYLTIIKKYSDAKDIATAKRNVNHEMEATLLNMENIKKWKVLMQD